MPPRAIARWTNAARSRPCCVRDPRDQAMPPAWEASPGYNLWIVLRAPFRAGAAHVMKLGPVGVAGDPDQPLPARHDRDQTLTKRRRRRLRDRHGAPLNAACRAWRRTAG